MAVEAAEASFSVTVVSIDETETPPTLADAVDIELVVSTVDVLDGTAVEDVVESIAVEVASPDVVDDVPVFALFDDVGILDLDVGVVGVD